MRSSKWSTVRPTRARWKKGTKQRTREVRHDDRVRSSNLSNGIVGGQFGNQVSGNARHHQRLWACHCHVCVCVLLLYSVQLMARGVPYLLLCVENVGLSSTQLTIIETSFEGTRRRREKGVKIFKVEADPAKRGWR